MEGACKWQAFSFMEEEDGNPNSLSKSHNQSHSQGGTTERNMKKKNKKHSLPLRMFVSVDGDDMVRPDCPNASNPFHKCADYCSLRTSEARKHEGSKGVKKVVEARRHVDPNCRYASNPYHSCGPYCYEDEGESSYGSYSSSSFPQLNGEKKEDVKKTRDVDPMCKNASNPFHKCSDYCFRGSTGERRESVKDVGKGRDGDKVKRNVNPNCADASNPFHVCGSYCLPVIPKKGQDKGNTKKSTESSNCKYASNPFHNCSEFCSSGEGGFDPKKAEKRNVYSNPEKVSVRTDETEVSTVVAKVSEKKPISRNSSTSCSESSKEHFQSFYEQELLERFGILRDNEDDLVETEKREMHLMHIDSFDLNHQFIAYCRQGSHEEYFQFEKVLIAEKSMGDWQMQHNQWINTCNSEGKISAYCLQKLSESDQSEDGKTLIPSSSAIRFALLLLSVLYYIAHVIITGGGAMDQNTSRIKERKDEKTRCNMNCFDEMNREM
ncbi:putative mRNA splicing factor SYF2 [Dioscorea sansibarensis]